VDTPPTTTENIMTYPTKCLRLALLGATLIAGAAGAAAVAQTTPTFDPAQLPATKGRVAQYSLTPRGDVDGLILDDGTEIHMPPHLGAQLAYAVKPGDQVTVRGLRAREVPMVQAMQVTNDATNQSVTDAGPGGQRGPGPGRHADAARQPLEAQGVIKAQLHGPRGNLNGVLLADGTIARLPPPEARKLAPTLAVGQSVFVRGDGVASGLGRVIGVRAIGPNPQQLTEVAGPHMRRDGPDGAGPEGERHGPRHGGPRGPAAQPPAAPL
jgi:hypothetical protein